MILGLGIDSVSVKRVGSLIDVGFLKRFLHQEEAEYFRSLKTFDMQVDYVAKLWAIKEACVKAWPEDIAISQVTVIKTEKGYSLKVTGCNAWISVTSDKDYVTAVCVIEEEIKKEK